MGYFLVSSKGKNLKLWHSLYTDYKIVASNFEWKFWFVSQIIAFPVKPAFRHFFQTFLRGTQELLNVFKIWWFERKNVARLIRIIIVSNWRIILIRMKMNFKSNRPILTWLFFKSDQSGLSMVDSSSLSSFINSLLRNCS